MTPNTRRVDKRTVLGIECWSVSALSALAPENVGFTLLMAAVGASLVFRPDCRTSRAATSSKLLLQAK